jgi:hypothetical protein
MAIAKIGTADSGERQMSKHVWDELDEVEKIQALREDTQKLLNVLTDLAARLRRAETKLASMSNDWPVVESSSGPTIRRRRVNQ